VKTKLLFVVTEDWYFVSHRLALGIAAVNLGYEVVVATRVRDHGDVILNAGIRVIPFELSRRSGNPFKEIWKLFQLYQNESPQIIHHVALKPAIYGSIASWLAYSNATVNAISGLGWIFTSSRWTVRMLRPPIRWIMGRALSRAGGITIVQNTQDRDLLNYAGVNEKNIRLIPGAGVDVDVFYPEPKTEGIPCVMLVARMLWDKGIGEFVEAARILADQGVEARFILVGDTDFANPAAIPEEVLLDWRGKWGVDYWGRREDMPTVWQSAHIACLPSYREGMPKSLLEAAACGLPIVTTDVPGCQEVIVDGQEGLLVQPKDAKSLAKALKYLIEQPALRRSMGEKARKRAEALFCQEQVIAATLKIYSELLASKFKNEENSSHRC
jgi:glycosyltransferase involved in cell wall biosynthesis